MRIEIDVNGNITELPDAPAIQLTQAEIQSDLINKAILALEVTDRVALRCWKANVPFPIEWQIYTTELRAIVNGTDITSISLPTQPAYPSNT